VTLTFILSLTGRGDRRDRHRSHGGRMLGLKGFPRGATQLGFVDILTVVILLGILLWAATLQFSAYNRPAATAPAAVASH
jgi:hypothetical protein